MDIYNKITVGTCSICGGPVMIHRDWMCSTPDIPTCANCGAQAANTYGDVIPMKPATPIKQQHVNKQLHNTTELNFQDIFNKPS